MTKVVKLNIILLVLVLFSACWSEDNPVSEYENYEWDCISKYDGRTVVTRSRGVGPKGQRVPTNRMEETAKELNCTWVLQG